jgi:site-specific DNA-methyltransferase (adenine-specific)
VLELNKLYHGDCLEVMKQIDDESINMILCDLPYGTTACKWDTVIPFEPLWEQYKRIIKDNAPILLFGSEPFSSILRMSNIKWYKYDWIWNKIIAGNVGLANKQPLKTHEIISVFYNKQPIYNPQFHNNYTKLMGKFTQTNSKSVNLSSKVKKLSGQRGFPRSIIEIMRPNNMTGGGLHPTQKPVSLFEYLIKTYTNEGDLVLDNCAGSGTTGVACINTNRKYILIEKDKEYFGIAVKRCSEVPVKLC